MKRVRDRKIQENNNTHTHTLEHCRRYFYHVLRVALAGSHYYLLVIVSKKIKYKINVINQ